MMKSELLDLLNLDDMEQATYNKLELWYMAIDLDKAIFAEIVKAVGIATLTERAGHADIVLQAMTDYERKSRYQYAKGRLKDIKEQAEDLTAEIEEYERLNRIMPD